MPIRNKALFIVLAALALIVWWRWSPEQARPPEREAPTATRAEPGEPPETPVQAGSRTARGQERIDLDRPGLAPERLELDRRPWDPKRERNVSYELRTSMNEALDRFVAETGMSDERFQKLLMILYDHQENMKLSTEDVRRDREHLDYWAYETRLHDAEVLWYMMIRETRRRVEELLTPEEYRSWDRMMRHSSGWMVLSAERIIVPAGGSHPAAPGT